MTKKTIGKIERPGPLSKIELMERAYRQKCRELKIARTRASVLRSQITRSYEILENIRFDFLGDTMFRDYIVGAKRELEGAMSDFLLSDTYWDEKIKEYRKMTPEEYYQETINNQSGKSSQSK